MRTLLPVAAVLFDLDGVLTPTATVHRKAWAALFSAEFDKRGVTAYTAADYVTHLDGRQRYAGVQSCLESRGIQLPYGSPSDSPDAETVCGLGNRKNVVFAEILEREGVTPYPDAVSLLDYLQQQGVPIAVVSSSKNAESVLKAAGLYDRFEAIVDGVTAEREGMPSKPEPDVFLAGAKALGQEVADTAVIEDAISGVAAGAAGGFGQVIGVAREDNVEALTKAGATRVVLKLTELF